jgi:hypothetical protein
MGKDDKQTDDSEDLRVEQKIILEWILRKWVGRCELHSSALG